MKIKDLFMFKLLKVINLFKNKPIKSVYKNCATFQFRINVLVTVTYTFAKTVSNQ